MRRLVLWGHHVDEYHDMFDVSFENPNLRVLEYGCGASAVNRELQGQISEIISCDPLFYLDKKTLHSEIETLYEERFNEIAKHQTQFDFSRYGSLDNLNTVRREGMALFLADFEMGKASGRYKAVDEKPLPFENFHFDIALCANYLFANPNTDTIESQVALILELARVAKEVRIFPLVDGKGSPSPLLGPVLLRLQHENYGVEVRDVAYRLQPMGNAMLRVFAQHCVVG